MYNSILKFILAFAVALSSLPSFAQSVPLPVTPGAHVGLIKLKDGTVTFLRQGDTKITMLAFDQFNNPIPRFTNESLNLLTLKAKQAQYAELLKLVRIKSKR